MITAMLALALLQDLPEGSYEIRVRLTIPPGG